MRVRHLSDGREAEMPDKIAAKMIKQGKVELVKGGGASAPAAPKAEPSGGPDPELHVKGRPKMRPAR